jgi:hypothetical protein
LSASCRCIFVSQYFPRRRINVETLLDLGVVNIELQNRLGGDGAEAADFPLARREALAPHRRKPFEVPVLLGSDRLRLDKNQALFMP